MVCLGVILHRAENTQYLNYQNSGQIQERWIITIKIKNSVSENSFIMLWGVAIVLHCCLWIQHQTMIFLLFCILPARISTYPAQIATAIFPALTLRISTKRNTYIAKIDTKLLEWIILKNFESKNVLRSVRKHSKLPRIPMKFGSWFLDWRAFIKEVFILNTIHSNKYLYKLAQ